MAEIKAGGKNFKSKEKLTNYIKFLLINHKTHTPLAGSEFAVIDDVFKMHEHYYAKTKGMTYEICTTQCDVNPRNNKFYIKREDGAEIDFSYYKALTPHSKLTKLKCALRRLVDDQTKSYKKQYFEEVGDYEGKVYCPVTGLKIGFANSNLDHYPTQFDELVFNWLKENKLDYKEIELTDTKDTNDRGRMKSKKLEESFYKYHLENANYRIVIREVNQQRSKAKIDWD